jgi:hypothetical protein
MNIKELELGLITLAFRKNSMNNVHPIHKISIIFFILLLYSQLPGGLFSPRDNYKWYFVTKIVLTYCENFFLQMLRLQPRISKAFLDH